MSNYNYDDYIKNGCHPTGYNEPCESYVFGQSTVDMLLDKLAEKDAENKKLKNIVDGVDKLKQYDASVDEYVLINENNVYADGNKLVVKVNVINKELLESVKLELLEFVKRHNGIIYGMIPEQVMAEQIEKCISEKIKMLGENK